MLYTVGDLELYERCLADTSTPFRLAGRFEEFEGGVVHEKHATAIADALEKARSVGKPQNVYGVVADRDAAEWLLIDMGWLLHDCDVVRVDSRGKRVYPHRSFHIARRLT